MKIKTRWFMIEIKKYKRCKFIYSQQAIDDEIAELKKKGLDEYIRKGKRCIYYKNYGMQKGCPFHGRGK